MIVALVLFAPLVALCQLSTGQPYLSDNPTNPYFSTQVWKIFDRQSNINATTFTVSTIPTDAYATISGIAELKMYSRLPEYNISLFSTNLTITFVNYHGMGTPALFTLMFLFTTQSSRHFITLETINRFTWQNFTSVYNKTSTRSVVHTLQSIPLDVKHELVVVPMIRSCDFYIEIDGFSYMTAYRLFVDAQILSESAIGLAFTIWDNTLMVSAGLNLIILDLSLATVSRDAVWEVGSYGVLSSMSVSHALSNLANSTIFLGLSRFELDASMNIRLANVSIPLVFNRYTNYTTYSIIQVQSIRCPNTSPFFVLEDKTCYPACPVGYQSDFNNSACYKCHPSCRTCNGPLPENCATCDDPKYIVANSCKCPSTMGIDSSGKCIECDPSCMGCFGVPAFCLACRGMKVRMWNGTCRCPVGTANGTNNSCILCSNLFPGAVSCSLTAALSCLPMNNFQLKNGLCVCNTGYAVSPSSGLCEPCSTFMPGCLQCANPTYCTVCNSSFTAQYGYCRCPNVSTYARFVTPTITQCVACPAGCAQCLSVNKCLSCTSYYIFKQSMCVPICGDGMIVGNECEDNNTMDGDGCSSNCNVEAGYICSKGARGLSICVYKWPIQYKLGSQYKNPFSNEIKLNFELVQGMPAGTSFVVTNYKEAIEQAGFTGKTLTLLVKYQQSMQFSKWRLDITPTAPMIGISLPVASSMVIVNPCNLPAYWYTEWIYLQLKIASVIGLVLSSVATVFFLVATLFNVNIGIETISPVQVVYFSVFIGAKTPQPVLYTFTNSLLPAVGYNKFFSNFPNIYPSSNQLSRVLNSLETNPLFVQGFNYMFALQLSATVAAAILHIVIRRSKNKLSRTETAASLVNKLCYAIAIYNVPTLFCSLGLNLAYFVTVSSRDNAINIVLALFAIALLIVNTKVDLMNGAVHASLPVHADSQLAYSTVLIVVRAACGLAAGVLHYSTYGLISIVLVQLALLLYYFRCDQFEKCGQRARAVITQLSAVVLPLITLLFESLLKEDAASSTPSSIAVCWTVLAVLSCMVCINIAFTIRAAIRKRQNPINNA